MSCYKAWFSNMQNDWPRQEGCRYYTLHCVTLITLFWDVHIGPAHAAVEAEALPPEEEERKETLLLSAVCVIELCNLVSNWERERQVKKLALEGQMSTRLQWNNSWKTAGIDNISPTEQQKHSKNPKVKSAN